MFVNNLNKTPEALRHKGFQCSRWENHLEQNVNKREQLEQNKYFVGGFVMTELLNKMIRLDIEINHKISEIEKWKGMRLRITTALQEDKSFGGGGVQDKVGELTSCILDFESELLEDIRQAKQFRKDFEKILEKINDPNEYDFMYRKYILFQPLGTIAKEMHYSKDGLIKMHNRILQRLNEVYTTVC
jgi:hypothetical protein